MKNPNKWKSSPNSLDYYTFVYSRYSGTNVWDLWQGLAKFQKWITGAVGVGQGMLMVGPLTKGESKLQSIILL